MKMYFKICSECHHSDAAFHLTRKLQFLFLFLSNLLIICKISIFFLCLFPISELNMLNDIPMSALFSDSFSFIDDSNSWKICNRINGLDVKVKCTFSISRIGLFLWFSEFRFVICFLFHSRSLPVQLHQHYFDSHTSL